MFTSSCESIFSNFTSQNIQVIAQNLSSPVMCRWVIVPFLKEIMRLKKSLIR